MSKPLKVKRSQIWIADLNPGFGVEIHKKRPVLVISSNVINSNWPRIIVLPFSSRVLPTDPSKILVPKGLLGLDKDSVILTSDVRSIDKSRLIKKIGTLPKNKLSEVEDSLKLVLGMVELE